VGNAERELLRTGTRYSLGVRLVVVLVSTAAPLIFEAAPVPAAMVLVAVGLIGWNTWYSFRFTRRGRWLVPADVAVLCAVCLTQVWTVPTRVSPAGITWVIGVAGITVIAYAWQLGPAAHTAATLTVMAAYLAGAAIADPQGWLAVAPIQLWLVIEAALSRALYLLVRHGARSADAAVARGERARRDAVVAGARRDDEREYLAALHDTASATLLMIASGVASGRCGWLSEQAARDLEVVSGRYRTPSGDVDLAAHLGEVARGIPLTVRWDAPEPVVVPAVEAATLAHGVREALTNVVRHADVAEAVISIRRDEDTVIVEVADQGVGFDPLRVGGYRYGVARSIVDRMARAGGRAEVISSPGKGSRVRLVHTLAARDVAGHEVETISTNVGFTLGWSVLAMNLIILYGLDLPRLLSSAEYYRPLWAQWLTLGTLTGVTMVVAGYLWRRRPLGALRWPLVAVVFAVSIIGTASVPADLRLGFAHWSEGDAAWTLVLVLLDSRFVVLVGVLAAHYAMTFLQTALGGAAVLTVAEAVNATVIVLSYQVSVGVVAAALRPVAVTAAASAQQEEQVRTARAVADQLHRDRTARYATLAETTGPLLAGLAEGTADPGDPVVRRSCAVEAARMRRLFAADAANPDPLSLELRAGVELAERNGIAVQFAERGARPLIPDAVRRALTEPAMAALATAASTARLTVIGSPDEVTVSVVADAPADVVAPASVPEVDMSARVDGDKIWIKATWRPA
jgi:signal transduction histidine kinase